MRNSLILNKSSFSVMPDLIGHLILIGSDDAVGGGLDVLVKNKLADAAGVDVAGTGVLDGNDVALDGSLYGRVFQGKIGIGAEGAVFKDKILGVAERLTAGNMAANQLEASGMPAKEFAVNN